MVDPPSATGTAAPARAGGEGSPPPGPLARPVSRGVFLAVAAGLAAIVAATWLDGRKTQFETRAEIAKRLTDSDAALALAKSRESELANQMREAEAKLTLLETRQSESQTQQDSLEALYREIAPTRDELALNEVEQVLLLASQQLAIAGNVQGALAALQLAEAKLARVDRPQLVSFRRALSRDIDRLKSVPFVDVAGISLKLDQALASIESLPLAKDERLPAPAAVIPTVDEPRWRRLLRDAWEEVRSLVRVEVADRQAAPLVAPQQQYFLRENLRLRLLAARIALLSRDDTGFKSDVTAANAWVKQYFDTRTKTVQTLSAMLAQLAATPMPSDLPDVAASLNALRAIKATRERSADKTGAAAPRR